MRSSKRAVFCIGAAIVTSGLLVGLIFPPKALSQQPDAGRKDIVREEGPGSRFDQGRKWAVAIGVNDYLDPTVPDLRYCVDDARLVAATLTEHCGYPAEGVLLMTDDQQKPHLRPLAINLRKQVASWLKLAGPGDTVLVFFSGHGFLDSEGRGYLAPQDCDRESLELTGLRTEKLRDLLAECRATQKLLVLDCCHAGAVKSGDLAGPASAELGAAFKDAAGLITLTSCRGKEFSREWEGKRHGLFTYFLDQGLRGAADYDGNLLVDSDELYRFTFEKVATTARRELNAQQTPVRYIPTDVVGVFILGRMRRAWRADLDTLRPRPPALGPLDPAAYPPTVRRLLEMGEKHRLEGDYANAVKVYDSVLQLDPRNRAALQRRGAARLAQGDEVGALLDFELSGRAPLPLVVLAPKAHLQQGRKINATLSQGQSVEVTELKDDWAWVTSVDGNASTKGWIKREALVKPPAQPQPAASAQNRNDGWEEMDAVSIARELRNLRDALDYAQSDEEEDAIREQIESYEDALDMID